MSVRSWPRCAARRWGIILLLVAATPPIGCDDKPTLPPELQKESKGPAVDVVDSAVLTCSESIVVPNLRMEISGTPGQDGPVTVALQSHAPRGYPAMMLTCSARLGASDKLIGRGFSVDGPGAKWIGPTEGIRTQRWRYQVETARIIVQTMQGGEARGSIEGTFYRFHRQQPTREPGQAEHVRGTFRAKLSAATSQDAR